ncbi:MAG: EthD domain-containing protein [Dehalococcoidia bacterium]
MIKTLSLMKRKAGISREEFVSHYEEVHVPLSLNLLPWFRHYARNHFTKLVTPGEFGFDCLSQFWFDSLEDPVKLMEFVQSDDGLPIREDEQKFLDTSATTPFLVEEKSSGITEDAPTDGSLKTISFLKRKPGISRQEFESYYEANHVPLIVSRATGLIKYVRNYVVALDETNEPLYDCITELWFRDLDAYKATMTRRLGEGRAEIEADEEKFLDMSSVVFVIVDERISK